MSVYLRLFPSICEHINAAHQRSFVPVVPYSWDNMHIYYFIFWVVLSVFSSGEFHYSSAWMHHWSFCDVIVIHLTLIHYSFLFITVFSDDDYVQINACCTFKGTDLEDTEYILTSRFNEKLRMQYNSTRGNWIGFTAYSVEAAKNWNADPYDALQRAFEKNLLCTDSIDFIQKLGRNIFS